MRVAFGRGRTGRAAGTPAVEDARHRRLARRRRRAALVRGLDEVQGPAQLRRERRVHRHVTGGGAGHDHRARLHRRDRSRRHDRRAASRCGRRRGRGGDRARRAAPARGCGGRDRPHAVARVRRRRLRRARPLPHGPPAARGHVRSRELSRQGAGRALRFRGQRPLRRSRGRRLHPGTRHDRRWPHRRERSRIRDRLSRRDAARHAARGARGRRLHPRPCRSLGTLSAARAALRAAGAQRLDVGRRPGRPIRSRRRRSVGGIVQHGIGCRAFLVEGVARERLLRAPSRLARHRGTRWAPHRAGARRGRDRRRSRARA